MNPEQVVLTFSLMLLALVVVFFLHYRHKTRSQVQETIRSALGSGSQLTPELIQALGEPAQPKHGDLRRGVILMCIGGALFLSGLFAGFIGGDREGAVFFMVISTFPLLVGAAYILLWRWIRKSQDE